MWIQGFDASNQIAVNLQMLGYPEYLIEEEIAEYQRHRTEQIRLLKEELNLIKGSQS